MAASQSLLCFTEQEEMITKEHRLSRRKTTKNVEMRKSFIFSALMLTNSFIYAIFVQMTNDNSFAVLYIIKF